MRVYHGSTFIVKNPNVDTLNNRTNFGKGFYTITDIEQAKNGRKLRKKD